MRVPGRAVVLASLMPAGVMLSPMMPAAQTEPQVDVRSLGAKGDGKTDDTAAFRSALQAAKHGGVVYLPCGTYVIDPVQPLQPHSGTIVRGASMACTIVRYGGETSDRTLFRLAYDRSAGFGAQIRFEDLMIQGRNVAGTTCLFAGSAGNPKTQHITLRNVKITQCDPGIKTGDLWYLVVDNSLLEWNRGSAVEFAEPNAVTGAFFENGTRIGNNGGSGILHDGKGVVVQLVVRDSEVSYNGATEIVTGNARDVAVESVWMEESSSPRDGIDLTGCLSCTVNEVHSDHALHGVIARTPVVHIRISNSSFTNTLQSPISLPPNSEGVVTNIRADAPVELPASLSAVQITRARSADSDR